MTLNPCVAVALQLLILQQLPSGLFSDPYELQQLKSQSGEFHVRPELLLCLMYQTWMLRALDVRN